jgi:hypothetical protein
MPKINDYTNFILINLLFMGQISMIYYWFMMADIKKNWNMYRCNPMFMLFADNIEENFNYCIQSSQSNYMSFLLQPLNYLTSFIIDVGDNLNTDINGIRGIISVIRDFVKNIVQSIFGVFMNLVIEIQKMTIGLKDMVGKLIGTITVLLYVLSGSINTMESLWNGPPGQLVKNLGKMGKMKMKGGCFHPKTKIKLMDKDELVEIKKLKLGDILKDGSIITGIIKLSNRSFEDFYEFTNQGEENTNIYVTGEHYIKFQKNETVSINNKEKQFIKVKNYVKNKNTNENIKINKKKYSNILYNLTTDTNLITIGENIFWDWEDDDLTDI